MRPAAPLSRRLAEPIECGLNPENQLRDLAGAASCAPTDSAVSESAVIGYALELRRQQQVAVTDWLCPLQAALSCGTPRAARAGNLAQTLVEDGTAQKHMPSEWRQTAMR